MHKTWIVVADASYARFFNANKPTGPITEIETLSNPVNRLHEGDLVSDQGGRDSNRGGGSHGIDAGGAAKTESANRFAAEVCRHLEKGRQKKSFDRLYVMAAPGFLGMLRKHQSRALRDLIRDEVAKDLATRSAQDIRDQLPGAL
jgi:protein required for attachment to host cells